MTAIFLLLSALSYGAIAPIYLVQESDIQRMVKLGAITQNSSLQYSEDVWKDSTGKSWKFQIISQRNNLTPVFFIPHDNEQDSFRTAIEYLNKYRRGTIIAVECGEKRLCGTIDPNRHFKNQSYQAKVFSYFSGQRIAITLHNNAEGCVQNGGAGNIHAQFPYSGAEGFARGVSVVYGDYDDVVIHNGRQPPQGFNAKLRKFLESKRINELYEKNPTKNDGSMSFAASQRGLYYFNVDAKERANYGPSGYKIQFNILEGLLSWYQKEVARLSFVNGYTLSMADFPLEVEGGSEESAATLVHSH